MLAEVIGWAIVVIVSFILIFVHGLYWYDSKESVQWLDKSRERDGQEVPERSGLSWRLFRWLYGKFNK